MSDLYDISVETIDGEAVKLSAFSGKVLLLVNVASACGLTPQYEALEAMYKSRKEDGLEILGFPCNQFGAQEPGTEAEIKTFCASNFGVSFPMFSKVDVNGDSRHTLYKKLLESAPLRTANNDEFVEKMKAYGIEAKDGEVLWNFEKFLVSREGEIIGHFSPEVTLSLIHI